MPWYASSLFAVAVGQDVAALPLWVKGIILAFLAIMSFVLGDFLGRKLRMPDHGWRISICLLSLFISVGILFLGPPLKWGIDLRGGAEIIYEVDQSKKLNPGETLTKQQMENLIEAVKRRVNPGGQKEMTIRQYGAEQIEVIIPEQQPAEVARIENMISRTGSLEFRILANARDNKELMERALAETTKEKLFDSKGNLLAWWVPVREEDKASFLRDAEIAVRERSIAGKKRLEVLVVKDKFDVTGVYLTRAEPETDQKGNRSVGFNFNPKGGQLFALLTGTHLPDEQSNFTYRLAIILDDEMCSAPSIQSTISDRGIITGSFTAEQVSDLVNVLNAGSLPAALVKQPISESYSGPTLGGDTITKGTNAMIIACILVPLFMLWYYRFSGLVANIALVLNMLILFAVMLTVKATFTLTAFAGLALTVGMAVDNNILVFERIREELARGATVRMAIRNAFHRAGTTIIDCNLTHLIAATVMWTLGSEQIKGFAITLWLGVATSMFTAVFVSRVIFDIAEKKQWLTKVKMLHLIGHTSIDFMKAAPYCIGGSIIVTVLAVVVAWERGTGLFDTDFTGGVSVQALFDKSQSTAEVRKALEDAPKDNRLPDLAISDVRLSGEKSGLRFVINTSEQDINKVKDSLRAVFGDKLTHNSIGFTLPKAIEGAKTPPKEAKESAPAFSDPYAGGQQSVLTFTTPVEHEAAYQLVQNTLEAMKLPPEFAVTNKDYTENDRTAYKEWTLKILLDPAKTNAVLKTLQESIAKSPIFPASNTIGAAVAGNTRVMAIYALVASWACIILYLWVRFQGVAFGLAAVVALVHDVLVMLGAVAISIYVAPYLGFLMIEPVKVNLAIVAAFLTIVGYSVNDTIVVFDRIREVRGKDPALTRKMVNDSTNQTLSRTLLTALTVFLVVIVLYIAGGEALHGLAFALLVGVATGTYSSIYVAAPILLWLVGRHKEEHLAG